MRSGHKGGVATSVRNRAQQQLTANAALPADLPSLGQELVWAEHFSTTWGWAAYSANQRGLLSFLLPENHQSAVTDWVKEQKVQASALAEKPAWIEKLNFVARIQAFFCGDSQDDFRDIPLCWELKTPFQQEVLQALQDISFGQLISYQGLAEKIGRPGAVRAVGTSLARNPWPLIVPCHRVISKNRSLGGFSASGGLLTKQRLLALEGHDHFSATK